jgi:hypothetical protein
MLKILINKFIQIKKFESKRHCCFIFKQKHQKTPSSLIQIQKYPGEIAAHVTFIPRSSDEPEERSKLKP